MQTKIKAVHRKAVGRTMAAYAAYQTTAKVATVVADALAHTWTVSDDFTNIHRELGKILAEGLIELPGRRQREAMTYEYDEAEYNEKGWTLVRVPGVAVPMQAKRDGDKYVVRSARAADLETLRNLVDERVAAFEAAQPVFNTDAIFTPRLNVFAWDGKNEWEYRKERTARTFDSVLLPAELQAEIEADLKAFTTSRERLTRLEMPWRRGYLLSGPPGTGKTSVSLAIAASLGFNLASLSLTDIKSDGMLRKAVASLRHRTVLVIEDIDAYAVSRDRDHNSSTDGALSLSGLLNSLDGFETPEGLVTICTTNHIEQLDPALIRSGRLDRTFTVDYIQARELERLFAWFYEAEPPTPAPEHTFASKLAPAEVAELFKQHLDDPEAGWSAALERIAPRPALHAVA